MSFLHVFAISFFDFCIISLHSPSISHSFQNSEQFRISYLLDEYWYFSRVYWLLRFRFHFRRLIRQLSLRRILIDEIIYIFFHWLPSLSSFFRYYHFDIDIPFSTDDIDWYAIFHAAADDFTRRAFLSFSHFRRFDYFFFSADDAFAFRWFSLLCFFFDIHYWCFLIFSMLLDVFDYAYAMLFDYIFLFLPEAAFFHWYLLTINIALFILFFSFHFRRY